MSSENRLNGETYVHYLTDERCTQWGIKQKKEYQDRQDSRLCETMYIDYMNDAFFHRWTSEHRREYQKKQRTRLKTQNIDWLTDVRFADMDIESRQNLKKSISGRCVIS